MLRSATHLDAPCPFSLGLTRLMPGHRLRRLPATRVGYNWDRRKCSRVGYPARPDARAGLFPVLRASLDALPLVESAYVSLGPLWYTGSICCLRFFFFLPGFS